MNIASTLPADGPRDEFAMLTMPLTTELTRRLVKEHGCLVGEAYERNPDDGVLKALVRYYEIIGA